MPRKRRGLLPLFLGAGLATLASAQPFVYVSNQNSNTVSVINTRDNRVAARLTLSLGPSGIAVSSDGSRAYVVHGQNDAFFALNAANNQVLQGFVLPGIGAMNVVVAPNGQRAYATTTKTGQVSVVNTVAGAVIANLRVGNSPTGLALTPDGARLYVSNSADSTLSVIETSNNRISTIQIPGCASPGGIVAGTSAMFIACGGSNAIAKLNPENNAIEGVLDISRVPVHIALTPDGASGYVSALGSSTITVFDTAGMAVRNTIELPQCLLARCSTFGIAVTGDGRAVYVAEPTADKVHVINTDTKEVVASIQVDGSPRGLAITPTPRPVTPGANAPEVNQ
ncbi:MAG: hypothetical protein JNL98_23475 [Bryobacterales bacterium]|nr:hypothetical protein [Bryobacterales bacterium]